MDHQECIPTIPYARCSPQKCFDSRKSSRWLSNSLERQKFLLSHRFFTDKNFDSHYRSALGSCQWSRAYHAKLEICHFRWQKMKWEAKEGKKANWQTNQLMKERNRKKEKTFTDCLTSSSALHYHSAGCWTFGILPTHHQSVDPLLNHFSFFSVLGHRQQSLNYGWIQMQTWLIATVWAAGQNECLRSNHI